MSEDQVRYLENKREESYFDEDGDDDLVPPHAAASLNAVAAAPLAIAPPRMAADFPDENPHKRMKI